MVEVMYATRESLKTALDATEASRSNTQIDRELQSASRSIEGLLLRYFYPYVSTQTFDWPGHQYETPWVLRLDQRELTSVTAVTAAGVDITSSIMLRPDDAPMRGFPFTKLEIDLSTSAAFNSGATFQRAIAVTGVFGFTAAETPGGSMVSAFTDTIGVTGTCSDSTLVGVGNILRVDSERMIVTGRQMTATGQTITANLNAASNNNVFTVSNGAAFDTETIQVDGEKMSIQDIAGNQVTVIRGWDGSTLAQHTPGAAINAPRLLTVQRGALGTTAATHTANTPINVHQVPSLIRELCIAEALNVLMQSRRGYTQIIKRPNSGGEGGPGSPLEVATALDDLRRQAKTRYARLRTRTTARTV